MKAGKEASKRLMLIALVLLACLIGDRLSKTWALDHLTLGEPRRFLPGLLQLTLTSNQGAAFSLGNEHGEVMAALAATLTIILIVWVGRRSLADVPLPMVEQVGMGCLLGGAIGNLIDRFTIGRVTDFLEFSFISFPVFNVADALIDIGIGLIALSIFFASRKTKGKDSVGAV